MDVYVKSWALKMFISVSGKSLIIHSKSLNKPLNKVLMSLMVGSTQNLGPKDKNFSMSGGISTFVKNLTHLLCVLISANLSYFKWLNFSICFLLVEPKDSVKPNLKTTCLYSLIRWYLLFKFFNITRGDFNSNVKNIFSQPVQLSVKENVHVAYIL